VCVFGLAVLATAILYSKELGITDDGKVLLKTTHVWFGYVFAANLGWRVIWAFLGNRQARWSAILPFGSGYGISLKTYVSGLFKGDGPSYLGHNPVARLIISLFLLLLIVQAITGLVLAVTDIYYPPFGYWFASWVAAPGVDPSTLVPYDKTGIDAASWDAMRAFRSPFVIVHYWVFYALLFLIVIHILGVVVTELREGGRLVSAMFTGRKVFDRKPTDDV
jgi:Ni/Fe-hydrogenase 1 B-type cytochrome subunit